MRKTIGPIVVCWSVIGLWLSSPIFSEENPIPNPSFENGTGDSPEGWSAKVWNGEGRFRVSNEGRNGGRCVEISSQTGGDLSWRIDVKVQPFSTYRLSGWIKTSGIKATTGKGALINIHNYPNTHSQVLTGDHEWTRVEMMVETADTDVLNVNCLYGGWGQATGTAWYDDISLERLSTMEFHPEATLKLTQTGEPISPYIYGQFIEHLGRCIYGGIWAEMLEDRKFYYAVGTPESPWNIIGAEGSVTMVQANAFVGEHTPRVHLPGNQAAHGLWQGDLALRAGQTYEGRIVLSGAETVGPIEVHLVWGEGPEQRQIVEIPNITHEYQTYPLRFRCKGDTERGNLAIQGRGVGTFQIGTVSLMPAHNIDGMRPDTLALIEELDSPQYRWPGGNFVSGYNWRDGIGDRDRRPPRKNPAWQGVEHNDFGIDEFIHFCRLIETEPLVVVNTGLGNVETAVDLLRYCNDPADTPLGAQRAANGHPEPYQVKWWGIGNEMYGDWQLGHMPLEDYVKKHNQFVDAMRAADPSIHAIGVGSVGKWSETMLSACADHLDSLSEHFYCGEQQGLFSHIKQIPDNVRRIANAHREYRKTIPALSGKDIRIALDEWNYWYGPELYGQIGTRYFLKDALGIAAGLHEFSRNTDIYITANYAQTVNVIGCIKTSKTAAAFDTTGLILKMYRHHYGTVPIAIGGDAKPLDVAAALSEDGRQLTLGVVNPTEQTWELPFQTEGGTLSNSGKLWRVAGTDPMAYNAPGEVQPVVIVEESFRDATGRLSVPPLSATIYQFRVK